VLKYLYDTNMTIVWGVSKNIFKEEEDMKKFILRIMACLMMAVMIGTCMGNVGTAFAAEGTFGDKYAGNYAGVFIPASAFDGCEEGAVITVTVKYASAEDGWTDSWHQLTLFKNTDGWPRLLDAGFYAEGTAPAYNAYEMADVKEGTFTTTFTAAGVAEFLAYGDLGIQVAGVILGNWTVTPVGGSAPAEEPVETPVEEPVETPVEEPAETPAEEPVETPVEEPAETPAEEPVEEPVETPVEEPTETPATSDNTTTGREVKEGETVYTVKKGDCLWVIAKQFLGKGARYVELFERNNDILTDATLIRPGQEIIIPAK